jgi:hypothetical protein
MRELIKRILLQERILLEQKKSKWTLDILKDIAKNYSTKNEFKKNDYAAWQAAHKYGFFDEITKHMISPLIHWTKEMVHTEALKYQNKRDFMGSSRNAYQAALHNGWLNDVTTHMTPLGNYKKRMIYAFEFPDNSVYVGLTFDEKERQIGHSIKGTVFNYSKETSLIPTFVKITTEYIDSEEAQNLENCTISDYKQKGWKILNKAKAGGLGSCIRIWTLEKVMDEASKYKTLKEFTRNSPKAYEAAQDNGWLSNIRKILTSEKIIWTKELAHQEALKYTFMNDFINNSPKAFGSAQHNGWLKDITQHMEKRYKDWTKEELQNIANNYKTRTEFSKQEPTAYSAALRNKWLDDVTKHMEWKGGKKWTYDEASEYVKKYPTKGILKKNDRAAYESFRRKGWLNQLYTS